MGEYKKREGYPRDTRSNDRRGPSRDYKRDDRRDDRRDNRGDSRGDRELFSATCATCSKRCEVPFKPFGDKPVYCSDCFRANNDTSSSSSRGRDAGKRTFSKGDRNSDYSKPKMDEKKLDDIKRHLESVNYKLDKIIHALSTGESLSLTSGKSPDEIPKSKPKGEKKIDTEGLKNVLDIVMPAVKKKRKSPVKSKK